MRTRTLISALTILLLLLAGLAVAQDNTKVKIKKVAAPQTSPTSGHDMYMSYCASCHGTDAKGNGPAAPALKTAPTDLTTLSRNNKGSFPSDHVATVLAKGSVAAHGSAEMPIWGPVFRSINPGHETEVQLRIANLDRYLESLQLK